MSDWWYISCPRFTVAVEVEDGTIIAGAPIVQKFVGQPAKTLGNWIRSIAGEDFISFTRIEPLPYTYFWGNNEKRETLKGHHCRVLARGSMRSVMVEFADGRREIVSIRALRKEKRD